MVVRGRQIVEARVASARQGATGGQVGVFLVALPVMKKQSAASAPIGGPINVASIIAGRVDAVEALHADRLAPLNGLLMMVEVGVHRDGGQIYAGRCTVGLA